MTTIEICKPGEWKSPLTADLFGCSSKLIRYTQYIDNDLWFDVDLPLENGRRTIISRNTGEEILKSPWSCKTTVHEYGGLSWLGVLRISNDGNIIKCLIFSEKSDQRLYLLDLSSINNQPIAITPEPLFKNGIKYAELIYKDNHIICVRETIIKQGLVPVNRDIISISLESGEIKILNSDCHFYAHLRLSPDQNKICFISWNHPDMSWNQSSLFIADINSNELFNIKEIKDRNVSILSPEWFDNNSIYYICDKSNYWNLWFIKDINDINNREHVIKEDSDWADTLWKVGSDRHISILPNNQILAIRGTPDNRKLVLVNPIHKTFEDINLSQYTSFTPTYSIEVDNDNNIILYIIAAGIGSTQDLISINLELLAENCKIKELIDIAEFPVSKSFISIPYSITSPGLNDRVVHSIIHPATNPYYKPSESCPLLVTCHGGPTASRGSISSLKYSYFTSRGFNVCDINYGGSDGYGRKYRSLLNNQWGIIDYEDVLSVVDSLIKQGIADPKKILITGGSAGGFTVLNSLVNGKVFAAGASYYGVSDLELLAFDTHDFESRYLDSLIGPYPDEKQLYIDRSPITHADNLTTPLILFQGNDDMVVPKKQSEKFRDVCISKDLKYKYMLFDGEAHGFSKASTISTCIMEEFKFYSEVLNFIPNDL